MTPRPLGPALRALRDALAFFTVLPAPGRSTREGPDLARALLVLPVVGLLIGALLLAASLALRSLPHAVQGACLTVLWLGLTGALHFDGLCDTADAVFAARPREARLRIAADPHLGTFALAAALGVLLLKVAALSQPTAAGSLAAIPLLARSAVLPVAGLYRNHAASKLGAAARPALPVASAVGAAGMAAGAGLVALRAGPGAGGAAAGLALVLALGLGGFIARRLGGLGGDAYGAIIESLEAALLILAVAGA